MANHRWSRMLATIVPVTVAVLLLLAPGAAAAARIPEAAAPREAQTAPLNPAFVLWQAMRGLDPVLRAASPHGLGLVPSPMVGYTDGSPASEGAAGAYPAAFDLRSQGKLPPVRNQGSWGTCWTFGSTGSLESSSLPADSLDLSEDNLALGSGFNVGGAGTAAEKYNAGGNADMATAYFVRWGGPVLEADDAYGDGVTPAGLSAKRHVQDVDIWSGRASATDNDRIKYAVMTYGGADISMLWSDGSYNSSTRSYCYTGTGHPNHDVMVVGWDDAYAASNFSPAAAGNGAFIVRNSWGSSWGSAGYFYVSYYDTRFGRQYTESGNTYSNDVYTFEAAQPSTNLGAIYQYDPLGVTGYRGYGAGTPAWGANVFTATADSMLNAVGFYALAPNTAYEVWEGPSRTSLTKLTSGTLPNMGYHTVAVPSGTMLTGGTSFCVAIKLTTPGWSWPIAYESPVAGYTSAATASAGESYLGSNGTTWTDLTTVTANANVCLKAYASTGPASTTGYAGFAADATSGWKTGAQTVTVTATAGAGTGLSICTSQDGGGTWTTTAGASATISVSAQGAHQISYYAKDSNATEATHTGGYVNIDTVAPSTSDNHLGVSLVKSATISLTPADATSGMTGGSAKTEYKVDGAASYATGTSVVLSTLGSHTVAYRSTDKAGNVESPDKTFTVTVRAPVAPASSTTFMSFAPNASSGWQAGGQSVTVTASGGDGTGRTIHYTQDGGASWNTSTAASVTVPVTSQGAHHFEYYASDSLATESTHDAGWVNVDSIAPTTTDNHLSASLAVPATITLTPSDAVSGVKWTQYKVDGAASYATGASVVLATPGSHTVTYRSVDNASNVENPDKTFTVTVTAGVPTSASTFTGFAADATSGWLTSSPQTVHITASGGSGAGRTIHASQDGGASWSTAVADAADLPVATQGAHHVEFYASDSLATEAAHDAGWVNVDTVAPVTADDHAGGVGLGPLTVTLTPTDATSGMTGGPAKTEYKVDGAASYSAGTSVQLSDGTHTVAYRSTDKAGNVESPDKTFTVTVIGPLSPLSGTDYEFATDALSGWRNTVQQFTITAAGGSGTGRTIHYTLDGGTTWGTSIATSVDVSVTTEGAHHVQFYVDDSLNLEGPHDGWINVDTGKPLTKALKSSVRRGRRVALKYRVTDATPGCGKAVLKLQIRKRSRVVKTITLGAKATNIALSYRYSAKLKKGTYTWRVLATDIAGNAATKTVSARLVIK